MRKILALTCLLAIGFAMSASVSPAADEDPTLLPVATVAFSGYGEIKEDLRFVGELAGSPEMVVGLEFMLKMMLGGRGLEGLDEDRPWGAVMTLDEENLEAALADRDPSVLLRASVFVPVTDAEALINVFRQFSGEPEALEEGVFRLKVPDGPDVFMVPQESWVFLVVEPEHLARTPADPMALLDGLHEQYDLAVRLDVGNLPSALIDRLVAEMESEALKDSKRNPGESAEEHQLRTLVTDGILDEARLVIYELDTVTLGWALDHEVGTAYFDAQAVAKPDSKLAKEFNVLGRAESRFAALGKIDAAFTEIVAIKLSRRHRNFLLDLADGIEATAMAELEKDNDPRAEAVSELLPKAVDIFRETFEQGLIEGGGVVDLDVENMTIAVAGAMTVARGRELENVLEQIVEIVRAEEPELVDQVLKTNVEKYLGVDVHEITFPLPPDIAQRERWVELLGEEVRLRIGIDEDTVYFEAGRESTDAMETMIGHIKSGNPAAVDVLRWEFDVQKYAIFGAAVEGDNGEIPFQTLADALAESPGDDRITVTLGGIPDGLRLHVEVSRGILEAAAKAGSGILLKSMSGG